MDSWQVNRYLAVINIFDIKVNHPTNRDVFTYLLPVNTIKVPVRVYIVHFDNYHPLPLGDLDAGGDYF